jgi:hypothetical protein
VSAGMDNRIISSKGSKKNRCLSCGTSENMRRRKYCSIECRQKLRYSLNLRTGLLRALNTRYATFYFTDSVIILDVLPYGSGELFSYLYPRSHDRKPVDDYCTMSNVLGRTQPHQQALPCHPAPARESGIQKRRFGAHQTAGGQGTGPTGQISDISQAEKIRPEFTGAQKKNKVRLPPAGHAASSRSGR